MKKPVEDEVEEDNKDQPLVGPKANVSLIDQALEYKKKEELEKPKTEIEKKLEEEEEILKAHAQTKKSISISIRISSRYCVYRANENKLDTSFKNKKNVKRKN
jgi:ATP-dependent RNA helicase DDX41